MSVESIDTLVQKLTSGDPAAAEQVFRTYEPFLRIIVRRASVATDARQGFDSIDIVQSGCWLHLLAGFQKGRFVFCRRGSLARFPDPS